jgi:hypothetical protein
MIRRALGAWIATPTGRRTARDIGFLTVLFVLVWLAYAPALRHPPRADQWGYLIDTRGDHTFLDALRHSYSYNRTRHTYPGDTDLFRPVLFTVLAAEKSMFEGRVWWPQAVGITLHCAVCAMLLVLLRQIRAVIRPAAEGIDEAPDWFSYATVAFFALNPSVMELVIWAHLHGYTLFLLLVMGSMSCLLRYAAGAGTGPDGRHLWAAWALALVSAFTYELGQFYAIMAGVSAAVLAAPHVGRKRAAGLALAFAAIAAAYQVTNRFDQDVHRGQYKPENLRPVILERALTRPTVGHTARFATFTAVQPYFTSFVQLSYDGQRLQVAESVWTWRKPRAYTPAIVVSLAVLSASAGLAALGLYRLIRTPTRTGAVAFALPAGLYVLYGAFTVLGRMNMRPEPTILCANSYYAYSGLLFVLLTAAPAWFAVGGRAAVLRKWLAGGLFVLAAVGAERVWDANMTVSQTERVWVLPLDAIQDLVDARRGEPGFSFEIDYAASDPVPEIHRMPVTRIVFDEWMADPNPRYRVTIRAGKARVTPRE